LKRRKNPEETSAEERAIIMHRCRIKMVGKYRAVHAITNEE
jgi:hypothetical protein